MVTTLAIICLTILAGIGFHIEPSPVYPPFAMAASWASLLCFHAFSRSLLFGIHEETLFFYVAGVAAFYVGGLSSHFFWRPHPRTVRYDPVRVRNVLTIFLLVLGIAFPFYMRFISDLVAEVASGSFWVVLRNQLIEESTDAVSGFSLMDNMVVLADITVLIAWFHRDNGKWQARAAFVFFLVYNLLTAGRAGFVFVLVCLFTIESVRQRRIPWRPLAALTLVFIFAFFGLAILVRKAGASTEESLAENVPALVEGFQLYTAGALVAFDNLYRHPSVIPPTQNIDRTFNILAKKLGFHTEVPYLHAEYSTVGKSGLSTNVYTIYFTYFPQLGAIGSVAMMFLLGAGLTSAYFSAAGGSPRGVIMFAILFYGIPLSGYSENYFNNLNFMAKTLLATFLCYGFASRRRELDAPC
jgi:oligosaccharide repeat unit polymerase